MKVRELVRLLRTFNPEATVVLSHDGEGNGYAALAGYDIGNMVEGSPGPIDYVSADDDGLAHANCVVLYPE